MIATVTGDENEISIEVGGVTYTGDLHEASEDDEGPEIWQIDGEMLETESILCLVGLEDLAREFLERRGIEVSGFDVRSESFRE